MSQAIFPLLFANPMLVVIRLYLTDICVTVTESSHLMLEKKANRHVFLNKAIK